MKPPATILFVSQVKWSHTGVDRCADRTTESLRTAMLPDSEPHLSVRRQLFAWGRGSALKIISTLSNPRVVRCGTWLGGFWPHHGHQLNSMQAVRERCQYSHARDLTISCVGAAHGAA